MHPHLQIHLPLRKVDQLYLSLRSDTLRSDAGLSDVVPTPSTSSAFSDAELSLLKDRAVTEIMPGQWMHTQKQADGRIVLTPVDPRQELLTIKREAKGDQIMGAVGEHMIQQLSVHTQAIMKKVAFNPNARALQRPSDARARARDRIGFAPIPKQMNSLLVNRGSPQWMILERWP